MHVLRNHLTDVFNQLHADIAVDGPHWTKHQANVLRANANAVVSEVPMELQVEPAELAHRTKAALAAFHARCGLHDWPADLRDRVEAGINLALGPRPVPEPAPVVEPGPVVEPEPVVENPPEGLGHDAGEVEADRDDSQGADADEDALAWVVVMDTDDVPYGGALLRKTRDSVTIVRPAMTDSKTGAVYPQRWVQIPSVRIASIHESDEVQACAVALSMLVGKASPFGIAWTALAELSARITPPSQDAAPASEG